MSTRGRNAAVLMVLAILGAISQSATVSLAGAPPPRHGEQPKELTTADAFESVLPLPETLNGTAKEPANGESAKPRCLAWLRALLHPTNVRTDALKLVAAQKAIPSWTEGHWESPKGVIAAAKEARRVDGFVAQTKLGDRNAVIMETIYHVIVVVLPTEGEHSRNSKDERKARLRDVATQLFPPELIQGRGVVRFPIQVAGLNEHFLYGIWEPLTHTWPENLPLADCPAWSIRFETDGRFVRFAINKHFTGGRAFASWGVWCASDSRFDFDERGFRNWLPKAVADRMPEGKPAELGASKVWVSLY
ncbi:MAG: hypothetical protein FJ290_23835 [Planctomycetes bacterium]|nr:hypothetical protein [Planctomycetota bacterium]